MVGEVANTTRKDIRIGISASALVYRGLRRPSHGSPSHAVVTAWAALRTSSPYTRQVGCRYP